MTAIETSEGVGFQFTKVLDTVRLGYVDDEEVSETTDRSYWETTRGTRKTVAMADRVFEMAHTFEPSAEMSYNKYYIGLWTDGRPFNFVLCRPQKYALRLEVQLPQTEEVDALIETAELDVLDYDKRWGRYRFKRAESDLTQKAETLLQLMKLAHAERK